VASGLASAGQCGDGASAASALGIWAITGSSINARRSGRGLAAKREMFCGGGLGAGLIANGAASWLNSWRRLPRAAMHAALFMAYIARSITAKISAHAAKRLQRVSLMSAADGKMKILPTPA